MKNIALVILIAVLGILSPTGVQACATEDSTNCFWDATQHGNKQGRSFIDLFGYTIYAD